MKREKKRGLTPLLFAFLLLAATAKAEDAPETLLIGIGDVPQDAMDCALRSANTDECDPNYQRTVEALKKINETIDTGLKKKARDGIDVALPYNDDRTWLIQAGVHVGLHELTIDEVRSDPVRRAIDDERRANHTPSGSWVRHTLEVRPRMSVGFKPDADGPIAINSLLLGFLPQFSVQIQVTKHYDLPADFPTAPPSRVQAFKRLLVENLKNYLQLPSELGGGSLGPGESVQLESYLSATGLPSLVNQFASLSVGNFLVGAFTRAGFEYFQTLRYRRYTIQKLSGDKLRMVLETPEAKRWGPFADVGVHADLIIYDANLSLARAGYRWVREKNYTTEYTVDLASDEAKKALKRAYLWGDFGPADQLAQDDCTSSTGIHKTGVTDAKSGDLGMHAHGWRVKALKLGMANTHSKIDEVGTPVSCEGNLPSVASHVDELQKVREGFRANRIYDVGIRTQKTDANGGHSLFVKFNFDGGSSSHDEMLEFLRIANLVTEPDDAADLGKIKTELDAVSAQPNDKRTGRVHAYISLEFDAVALSTILSMKEDERATLLRAAYDKLMGADGGKVSLDPDQYRNHLKDLEKFLAAAKRGVSQPDDLAGAKAFLDGIEKTGLDLYPFAAVLAALPNADHVLGAAQIYLAGKTRDEDRLIDSSHAGRFFEDPNVPSQP